MNLYYKLSILMGVVVVISNYLVQYPVNHFGLNEILTYGAFSYPVTFLITDVANRAYGKVVARKVVYFGFFIGVLWVSTCVCCFLLKLDRFSMDFNGFGWFIIAWHCFCPKKAIVFYRFHC